MWRKPFYALLLVLLVIGALSVAFSIQHGQKPVAAPIYADSTTTPGVAEMIAQFDETEINRTILDLQNFVSRAYGKSGNGAAATYLHDRLAAISPKLTVRYQGSYNNVVATLPGMDSITYIVGAHYDSTSGDLNNAPGATDDAGGCAIVLEFARILSQYSFNHTLMFAFWNREEGGLLGSSDFVAHALPTNTELYYNFDSACLVTATRLDVMYNALSAPVAALVGEYNALYGIDLTLEHNAHTCNSDNVPFRNAGIKAIATHQQVYPGSPTPNNAADHEHQHTTTDTIQYVSTAFAKRNGQLGMSVVAVLAEPQIAMIIVPDDFATIQEAVDNAEEGYVVFVRSGTYYESLIINQNISLIGEGWQTTIIDGNGSYHVIDVGSHSFANVSGFTIRNGISHGIYYGGYWHNYPLSQPGQVVFVTKNNIVNCWIGLWLNYCRFFNVYLNNFENNTDHDIYCEEPGWNSYNSSSDGNYWGSYAGVDADGDGIGDTPCKFSTAGSNLYGFDYCPLMSPYLYADVNHDGRVDMKDVGYCCLSFGSRPGQQKWNPHCDLNEDGRVDMRDVNIACVSFGDRI